MKIGDKVFYDAPVSFLRTKTVLATIVELPEFEPSAGIAYSVDYAKSDDGHEPAVIQVFRFVSKDQLKAA